VFVARWNAPDTVTHRFILIEEGALDYTIEGRRFCVGAGEQIYVPAWCRREWTATSKGCRLLRCEFSSGAVTIPSVLFRRQVGEPRTERKRFERILELF
jgi:gentisate 1,2-dioxygenase